MYRVKLENFEGPLDLLLFFIKRDELDIFDIPITYICKEFFQYVHLIQQLDLDLAGDFLLMAANLMQIKVRMLLPKSENEDEEEEDIREKLIQRLLEYKRFKEVSESFKKMEDKQRKVFYRNYFKHDEVEAQVEDTNLLKEVSMFDLLKAFKKVIANLKEPSLYTIKKLNVSIEDQMEYIINFFENKRQVHFMELMAEITEKIVVIVTFVALLEMTKSKQIKIYTNEAFNDFIVYKLDEQEN
jgi:segregation and condensation protein A